MRPAELFSLRARLSGRDMALLDDLRRFRLLSTRHLQRLHFSVPGQHQTTGGATRAASRVLSRLHDRGLTKALSRRIGGAERGSAGALWQLTEAGHQLLAGGEAPRRRTREPTSGLFVAHTAAVSELAVAVTELCRNGGYELLEIAAEPDGWRQFVGPMGVTEHVRPDLVVITADAQWQQTTFFEVDLGTEHGPQLRRKGDLYRRYIDLGAAERDLGVAPRIVWVAPDETRARFMAKSLLPADPSGATQAIIVTPDRAAPEAVATLDPSGEEHPEEAAE